MPTGRSFLLSVLAAACAAFSFAASETFQVSAATEAARPPAPPAMEDISGLGDFRDVGAMDRYDQTMRFDAGEAPAEEKAKKWRELADSAPRFAEKARARAAVWDRDAAGVTAAGEETRRRRAAARDLDWRKLKPLLAAEDAPAQDKVRWAEAFTAAYGAKSQDDPYAAELRRYLGAETAKAAAPLSGASKAGIRWAKIRGGSFSMGADDVGPASLPRHRVVIKAFEMSKTLVTNKQYQACVDAGVCAAAHASDGTCYVYDGSVWVKGNLTPAFQGDDQPAVCVDWQQASKFAEWAGARLPTEAEWEYAARGGGKEQKYPWGDERPTCALAVLWGCGGVTTPVCSKPAGNTAQGLCDMAGNAWEWVEDLYHSSYDGAPSDGGAWEDEGFQRVIRGGSWRFDTSLARSASRFKAATDDRSGYLSFRLAR